MEEFQYDYDVFLSHASRHKPDVEVLASWLKKEGLKPFFDKWDLVPGENWTNALPKKLNASKTCAVIIGPGDTGAWQRMEVQLALLRHDQDRGRKRRDRFRIIPVLLPGASTPGSGEPSAFDFLGLHTWVQFERSIDEEGQLHRLACGIRGISPGFGPGRGAADDAGECPYRELQVFDFGHAKFFHGRERLTRFPGQHAGRHT